MTEPPANEPDPSQAHADPLTIEIELGESETRYDRACRWSHRLVRSVGGLALVFALYTMIGAFQAGSDGDGTPARNLTLSFPPDRGGLSYAAWAVCGSVLWCSVS